MSRFVKDRDRSSVRPEEASPSRAVVETVARREGVDETDLPPLFSVVDPDALDSLFRGRRGNALGRVVFTYCGYQVRVDGDGTVTLAEA